MKAFIICLCYAAGLGVLSFFLGRLLPKRWLHPDKFPFRTYAWEEKLWKALQIRKRIISRGGAIHMNKQYGKRCV